MIDINKKIMEAMKAHDKVASETYKLLKAKILEYKTSKNAKPYDDVAEITLIKKMIDDRQNSIRIYLDNNRADLADAEKAQVEVLEKLLPSLPTEEDVKNYLSEHYPNGVEKKQMGIVIKEIKGNLVGADGKLVSECVKSVLV
ncbi:MAG: GatB/YqeY domain-containing protein [Prevotella sp.]|nr:GatB/YqeY domain-containing protein [Prevotella sp.]